MAVTQEEINTKNESFWNELCGTHLAQQLGVVDSSKESLAKFDNFFFDFYPYLSNYLFLDKIKDKNVLEIGLGYGSVAQMLALWGANYHGLDIARNPVEMAKHRLAQHGISGDVRVGNMLECPFPDDTFDFVISIGCFHHTGDAQACIRQTHRVLKSGGTAMVMLYNKFSLRQIQMCPKETAQNMLAEFLPIAASSVSEKQRKAYDASAKDNEAAPETQFFSVRDVRKMFRDFRSVKVNRENFDEAFELKLGTRSLHKFGERKAVLDTFWTKQFGLDLYITATK